MITNGYRTRVVLADHQVSVRELLTYVICKECSCDVVGQANTGLEALALCNRARPQLVITDICLPEMNGVELLQRIRKTAPSVRIVVYTGVMNPECIQRALQARPHAFVGKSDPWSALEDAVNAVRQGRSYFNKIATELLYDLLPAASNGAGSASSKGTGNGHKIPLSHRETEILQMVAEGFRSKEIASRLNLAVKTVENHRANLMQKLHVHDIAGLTRYAMRHGVVIPHDGEEGF